MSKTRILFIISLCIISLDISSHVDLSDEQKKEFQNALSNIVNVE